MKVINVIQGTPEWLAHRATHFNASDAPAMLGISPYKTRSQLLHEIATGIIPEVDAATQVRFDEGHRLEAQARTRAEELLGKDLYPVTGTEGRLSASFDGLTMDEALCFEHKMLNNELRLALSTMPVIAPEHHRVQMEHGLMVSGAHECLFVASNDGEFMSTIYTPDEAMRKRIITGWAQFEKDLAAYVPPEVVEKPVAEVIMQLPAVVINATGGLSVCNLGEIAPRFDAFLSGAKTSLVTDDDFANGEATAKFSRATAKTLKMKAKEVVGQIATVSDAVQTLELYAEKFDRLGLILEKAVKEQKESIKSKIIGDAKHAFLNHVNALYEETRPIEIPAEQPDFAGAMKGMRTISSLHNAVNTELANAKIKADALAKDIRGKLASFKDCSEEYSFLFRDLQQIIQKPMDDFRLTVSTRINAHKAAESAKLEGERKRIQAEEEAKARVKIEAEVAEDQRAKPQVSKSEGATNQDQDQVAERQSSPPILAAAGNIIGRANEGQSTYGRITSLLVELSPKELGYVERYIENREWEGECAPIAQRKAR